MTAAREAYERFCELRRAAGRDAVDDGDMAAADEEAFEAAVAERVDALERIIRTIVACNDSPEGAVGDVASYLDEEHAAIARDVLA